MIVVSLFNAKATREGTNTFGLVKVVSSRVERNLEQVNLFTRTLSSISYTLQNRFINAGYNWHLIGFQLSKIEITCPHWCNQIREAYHGVPRTNPYIILWHGTSD